MSSSPSLSNQPSGRERGRKGEISLFSIISVMPWFEGDIKITIMSAI